MATAKFTRPIAGLFGDSEAVIAVVEEAQFEGLNVRFWKDEESASIMMGVSTTPDGTTEMQLSNANAYALLAAIGAQRDATGEIDLADLTSAITDPATRRYLEREGMDTYLGQLDAMASQRSRNGKRLVWA